MKKYKKTQYTGIRKNLSSNTYEAYKTIDGKTHSKTFKNINDARKWRISSSHLTESSYVKGDRLCFKELWANYEESYFPELAKSTQGTKKQKIAVFYEDLKNQPVYKIDPDFIDSLIRKHKKLSISNPKSKRHNFRHAIDELRAVLNWYREYYNHKFINPVLKRHYGLGFIKKTIKKEKVISLADFMRFAKSFNNDTFRNFALIQFLTACRFGEVAGIQLKNIDLNNNILLIKETVVEDQSKRFLELKEVPKNGLCKPVKITDELKLILNNQVNNKTDNSGYLFSNDCKAFRYRQVQYHYNKALKKCGLYPRFSSTHILRYTMATACRKVSNGSLDAAKSVTGHKSTKMIEHYAMMPPELQEVTINRVEDEIKLLSGKEWDIFSINDNN